MIAGDFGTITGTVCELEYDADQAEAVHGALVLVGVGVDARVARHAARAHKVLLDAVQVLPAISENAVIFCGHFGRVRAKMPV